MLSNLLEPTQECIYNGCGLSARPRAHPRAHARERAPAHCACLRLSLVNLRLLVGADSRDPGKYFPSSNTQADSAAKSVIKTNSVTIPGPKVRLGSCPRLKTKLIPTLRAKAS